MNHNPSYIAIASGRRHHCCECYNGFTGYIEGIFILWFMIGVTLSFLRSNK